MKSKTKTSLFLVIAGVLFFVIMKTSGGFKQAIDTIKNTFKKGA